MSGCSSDPTQGCDNGEVIVAINETHSVEMQELASQDARLATLQDTLSECCALLSSRLTTLLNLANEINSKL